jgi:Dynamin family
METELEQLEKAARDLAAAAKEREDLSARAERLADRLARGRFNVSVLGEFKRGKSTLVNALLGLDLMPTGVLPLTAVATEVVYGTPGGTVVHTDGSTDEIDLSRLSDYVTEAGNPANERQVRRVEARAPAALLRPGIVLVDTPGIGSVFRHDEVAARALLEADGAILVLSADAPLSEEERKLLTTLSDRRSPTFFVLNRADHLSQAELDQVTRFVSDALDAELGRKERLWRVSARAALEARLRGEEPNDAEGVEFAGFSQAFNSFVRLDLVQARIATARSELARLAHEVEDSLKIEAATAQLDAASLRERVERLQAAAGEQRQAFQDECTLLQRDVDALAGAIGEALTEFAAQAPSQCDARLLEVARSSPVTHLEVELRRAVEAAVRERFEGFRQVEAERAEGSWRKLAERFRDRTQERVNAVRAAAADIFQVELPKLAVPEVAEERERYFYLFLHVGSSTESINHLLRLLLPHSLLRRRLLRRAKTDLAEEFDKHAGRARWDISQRLDAVRRRFETAMASELAGSVETILAAASRAEQLRGVAEAERQVQQQANEVASKAAEAALMLAGER